MTRGKAEFVREATCKDWHTCPRASFDLRHCNHDKARIVRVNGHERLLYGWKDAKPFVFPRQYGRGPKAPRDKYSEAKAWATACQGVTSFGKPTLCGREKCPRCSEYTTWVGLTYAACPECNIIFNY